ncbi:MAG: creatininase family protein, partial [Pedobacter sp.]|nr:creatininase family protein [Pedobacter sp.]
MIVLVELSRFVSLSVLISCAALELSITFPKPNILYMKSILCGLLLLSSSLTFAQQVPTHWDEITATDWSAALDKSEKTCILPIGILEKHGPHSPLGTDLIHVREWANRATKQEYAVVFPDYFYGQINEAKQQPGTFALPSRVIYDLLEATCDEIARNGFTKIVILN